MDIEKIKTQMRKGLLELCVLHIIDTKTSYVHDIIKKLKKTNLLVGEGTLYPLLTRLKNEHLLEYKWEESNEGPPRKYYFITQEGKKSLKDLYKNWIKFSESINKLINFIRLFFKTNLYLFIYLYRILV